MTLSAAAYYAPAGIRINVIAPGLVRTPMSARAQGDARVMEYVARKQPLTRGLLAPEDIAKTACFLLRKGFEPDHGPGHNRGRRVDGERMTQANEVTASQPMPSIGEHRTPASANDCDRQLPVSGMA